MTANHLATFSADVTPPLDQHEQGGLNCTDEVRVIVAGELAREARNAPLHLFSASPELVGFGRGIYRQRSEDTSMLLKQLFESLHREDSAMYTMEDFRRDYFKKHFAKLTPEQRRELLKSLPAEERLAGLPAEERLAGLPAEERLAGLPAEERLAGLPPEARLAGLSAEQIRQYLEQLTAGRPAKPRKSRQKK